MRAEGWRGDHDHPKDRLQRGNRGIQEHQPDSTDAATQQVQKIVKIPQISDREHRDASRRDEQKIFTAIKAEDLEQNPTDIPWSCNDRCYTQTTQKTVEFPQLQFINEVVDDRDDAETSPDSPSR